MGETSAEWITEEVLRRLDGARDDRVREVSASLVRHLHAFIREIHPTQVEWERAIAFLTEVGKTCTSTRQEFILLSDTLGASTLVDALNAPGEPSATESTVLGPFYLDDPPARVEGGVLGEGMEGTPLLVEGKVTDTRGEACGGAVVDTWQSDAEGQYDVQRDEHGRNLRGRFRTDLNGKFSFWSIVPSSYAIPDDGPVGEMLRAQGRHPFRPAHVHFRISCPGRSTLTTHIFVAGDPYLGSDAVFGVKESLIEALPLHEPSEAPASRPQDRPFAWLRRQFVLAAEPR